MRQAGLGIVLVALMLLGAGTARAEDGKGMKKQGHGKRGMMCKGKGWHRMSPLKRLLMHKDKLELTDAQVKQIKTLAKESYSEIKSKRKAAWGTTKLLKTVVMADDVAPEQIELISQQLAKEITDAALARRKTKLALKKILTFEQQDKIKEWKAKKGSHCPMMRGKGKKGKMSKCPMMGGKGKEGKMSKCPMMGRKGKEGKMSKCPMMGGKGKGHSMRKGKHRSDMREKMMKKYPALAEMHKAMQEKRETYMEKHPEVKKQFEEMKKNRKGKRGEFRKKMKGKSAEERKAMREEMRKEFAKKYPAIAAMRETLQKEREAYLKQNPEAKKAMDEIQAKHKKKREERQAAKKAKSEKKTDEAKESKDTEESKEAKKSMKSEAKNKPTKTEEAKTRKKGKHAKKGKHGMRGKGKHSKRGSKGWGKGMRSHFKKKMMQKLNPIRIMIKHQDHLTLTDKQVKRLEKIAERSEERVPRMMRRIAHQKRKLQKMAMDPNVPLEKVQEQTLRLGNSIAKLSLYVNKTRTKIRGMLSAEQKQLAEKLKRELKEKMKKRWGAMHKRRMKHWKKMRQEHKKKAKTDDK